MRAPIRHATQALKQQLIVGLVLDTALRLAFAGARLDSSIGRRIDPRRATQGVHAQARVVGEGCAARVPGCMARLDQSVLDEAAVRFVRLGNTQLRATAPVQSQRRKQRAHLGQFLGVVGRQDEPHGSNSERRALRGQQFLDALARQAQHRLHLRAAEGVTLGRALQFDKAASGRHDHVHVGVAG